jgi:hypothetical protein
MEGFIFKGRRFPDVPGARALVAQWIEHQTSNLGVAGSSPAKGIRRRHPFGRGEGLPPGALCCRSGSLVVMTSALHAEGREFNPRPEYTFSSHGLPDSRYGQVARQPLRKR